jgi:hypothetical protein
MAAVENHPIRLVACRAFYGRFTGVPTERML